MTDNVIVKYLGYKKQFSALLKNGIKSLIKISAI